MFFLAPLTQVMNSVAPDGTDCLASCFITSTSNVFTRSNAHPCKFQARRTRQELKARDIDCESEGATYQDMRSRSMLGNLTLILLSLNVDPGVISPCLYIYIYVGVSLVLLGIYHFWIGTPPY